MRRSLRQTLPRSVLGTEIVRVLVGREQREFNLHKKLLCSTSNFFREDLQALPPTPPPSPGQQTYLTDADQAPDSLLLLPDESPGMFELFAFWLYQRRPFRTFIDSVIQSLSPTTPCAAFPNLRTHATRRALHWNLVRLHLFAVRADLPVLQDLTLDAMQDMYLACDWDMSPRFIAFLYGGTSDAVCDPVAAVKLRKWAVAMIGWTLYGGERGLSLTSAYEKLFDAHPLLWADYCVHLEKMAVSRADLCIKNPQLRLPGNNLRSEERMFGFRQCSFHCHRASVGQKSCPHERAQRPLPTGKPSPWRQAREAMVLDEGEEEEEDLAILKPVSEEEELPYLLVRCF